MARTSIRDDLKWIEPKNETQAVWLAKYLKKQDHDILDNIDRSELAVDYISEFKNEWEQQKDTERNRQFVQKVKRAWHSYSRTSKFKPVAVSTTSHAKLVKMAKRYDKTIIDLVNDLIVRAEDLLDAEMELRDALQSVKDNDVTKINAHISVLQSISDNRKQQEEINKQKDRIKRLEYVIECSPSIPSETKQIIELQKEVEWLKLEKSKAMERS